MTLNSANNKNKPNRTLGCRSRDMLNFEFLEKGLGIDSSSHFMYDLSRKIFVMLCSINWLKFIFWFPLLLEIFNNMFITFVSFPGFNIIILEINLIFLIKPFSWVTKKSRQKMNYFENEFLRWSNKHFSSFLKGFQLSKIFSDIRVHV